VTTAVAQSADTPAEATRWQPADRQQVEAEALAWLKTANADDATRERAAELWRNTPEGAEAGELHSRLVNTFAMADPEAAKLVAFCSVERTGVVLPKWEWLADAKTPAPLSANLRLLYGRWLARHLLFDEAAEQLAELKPDEVVDPASLLFYQAVVHHRLLNRKAGLATSKQLVEGAEHSAKRYVAVARLIHADLGGLKEDTLDHIARRMEDIQRRLDLGRAGPRVRGIEDGVIESLDKIIKQLEEQRSAAGGGQGSGQAKSNAPAPDSRILGGRGAGDVTKRGLGGGAGWGDLPPKEREKALQQIGREFPAHYRDVIEQYFRRLANE